jgi:hypothetical protein
MMVLTDLYSQSESQMMRALMITAMLPIDKVHTLQSRQSARLFLQSSELSVYPPPPLVPGGKHTRLREMGWGSPNSDEGTDNVLL